MDSLPSELLLYVLRYVSPSDRILCEMVCKRWKHHLQTEVWKDVVGVIIQAKSLHFLTTDALLEQRAKLTESADFFGASESMTWKIIIMGQYSMTNYLTKVAPFIYFMAFYGVTVNPVEEKLLSHLYDCFINAGSQCQLSIIEVNACTFTSEYQGTPDNNQLQKLWKLMTLPSITKVIFST